MVVIKFEKNTVFRCFLFFLFSSTYMHPSSPSPLGSLELFDSLWMMIMVMNGLDWMNIVFGLNCFLNMS